MSGRWALSLSLSLCVLFLAGCVDTHTSPEIPASDAAPTSSDPFFAIESAPVTLGTTRAPVLTYFCSTSRRTAGLDASGNARYEYGLLRFRYSEREYAVEAGGEEVDFIVHVNDDAGEIAWAAWCHIPRSPASAQRVLDRLGLAAHVSAEQVLSRPSPKRRAEGSGDFGDTSGAGIRPMWHEGDDDEDDDRCGPGYRWSLELGACVLELPPVDDPVPPSPPPEDPDPWPWPDPDPEDPGGGGGGDHGGGGTPPEPPPPAEECEAGEECEEIADFLFDIVEVEIDSTYIPVCPPETETRSLEHRMLSYAWCNAMLPTIQQKDALSIALNRIEARGGVCASIAQEGRALMQRGGIQIFADSVFPPDIRKRPGGLGIQGYSVRLYDRWFALLNKIEGDPGWGVNLEFAVVHEIEHYLNGPGHVTPPGAPDYYDATTNAASCAGL